MGKKSKGGACSAFAEFLAWCFVPGRAVKHDEEGLPSPSSAGPAEAIIAAENHFSKAHKLRLTS
ncbi:hypothetical protein H6P81_008585 [Aristolochia fimbriata]|uniref:Uncharacterized protein n=1 Tax=Aristolochia fimbriata TaxID=158543 RepID=A0AAV7EIF3_ARIFI|nr:hypothetical protein H6P81_008585 [Aristolochia fimbriata]